MYQAQTPRHKVFISFHHDDQTYKESFSQMMDSDIVDESVGDGDIDDTNLSTDRIRQIIRDDFIRDATVTVVLIGPCTWQRKHVDWEIGSSLRSTKLNSRCGLLGILLPNHRNYRAEQYDPHLIPPRLADNCIVDNPYAKVYHWSNNASEIRNWIHTAFERRNGSSPTNARAQFKNNRSGDCYDGWRD